jgi:GNAT superfamily N-acetyltransferase
MTALPITLHETAPDGLAAELFDCLRGFNQRASGQPRGRYFMLEIRDPATNALMGGLSASLWSHTLHIGVLWVHEDLRGHGQGAELVRRAEAYASGQGAKVAHLDTLSFQARPFYEKQGYRLFGTVEEVAPGIDHYFLSKRLDT